MAIEPKQTSSMSKMDGTKLSGSVYLVQVNKNGDEEQCY